MFKIFTIAFVIILLLLSCRAVKTLPENYAAYQEKERKHMLTIFMDGTRDKPNKNPQRNTHVKKTHALAFDNIKCLYVEGVGAGNRLIQAAKGSTTKERIMKAYRFLSENYEKGDSICLFGFSRGANQCRILSSIIYTVGIINLTPIKEASEKQRLLLKLYDLYNKTEASNKKYKLATFLNAKGLLNSVHYDTSGKTTIELMGLWETVEAFERDRIEKTIPIPNHLNQLYNIKKIFHAVSLDDNRAYTYTPILTTHKDVASHPDQVLNSIVEEVWFNGSHKDVGGGVRKMKNDHLSGISLRWMLNKVSPYHIFRDTIFKTNTYGKANDMRKTWILRLTSPGDTLRGIDKYWRLMNPDWNSHRIKVHKSVIDRLAKGVVQNFKLKKDGKPRLDWYDWEPFKRCFTKINEEGISKIKFKDDCTCIEVVND